MKAVRTISLSIFLLCTLILLLPVSKGSANQDKKTAIDGYIETFLEEHQIPGASIAIMHENELFFSKAWGVTGETEEKVTSKTPFTIGSISKSLTGLAIMKLVEGGYIHLNDRVQTYLPWFTLKDKQAPQITIKQLLTHTSGISNYSGLLISDRELTDDNAIRYTVESLSNVKLTAHPGEKYQYSNANYSILGALIEEVTNQTYSVFMEQQIFLPLGMKNAAADKETAYQKGYLAGYQSWMGIPRKSKVTYDNGGAPYGYITASAEDMLQYIKFLSQLSDNKLLSNNNMTAYLSPYGRIAENRYYGLGLKINNPDSTDKMIWHAGTTPDSHTVVFFLPETGWGGVILTNKNHFLEEAALPSLKKGIIQILNGEEPADLPSYTPKIQLVFIGIVCLLFAMFCYQIVKAKARGIQNRRVWGIIGIMLIILAIVLVPLLISSLKSPWHTIKVFAPDIALLTIVMVIILALNGLLSIYLSSEKLMKDYD